MTNKIQDPLDLPPREFGEYLAERAKEISMKMDLEEARFIAEKAASEFSDYSLEARSVRRILERNDELEKALTEAHEKLEAVAAAIGRVL